MIKLLLEAGANVNLHVTHGPYGSALITAIARERKQSKTRVTLKTLLKYRADISLQLSTGYYRNALDVALTIRNKETI
jgi:hypothetical protein